MAKVNGNIVSVFSFSRCFANAIVVVNQSKAQSLILLITLARRRSLLYDEKNYYAKKAMTIKKLLRDR